MTFRDWRVPAAVLIAGICCASPTPAAPPVSTTIFLPSSGTPGPFVIVVVSDGYTKMSQFNNDANFIFVTRLMTDPFFAAHQSKFTIKTVYDRAPSSGASLYGVSTANRSQCDMSQAPLTTAQLIRTKAKLATPDPNLVVLLAKDSVSFACTTSEHWTYVTSGASDRNGIMAHELGHLIGGLYDEYDDGVTPYSGPAVDRSNCSTKLPPLSPYWTALSLPGPAPTNPAGCLYSVSGIVRPYVDCKMNNYDRRSDFCEVCRREMECALSANPAACDPGDGPDEARIVRAAFRLQPPPADEGVRLMIRVDTQTGQATVVDAVRQTVAHPVQRRVGDVAYLLTENGRTLGTGVLPGDPFQKRMYGRGPRHTTAEGSAATLSVVVPQITVATLLTRSVAVSFYRLTSSDPDPVTPDKLRAMIANGGARLISELKPDDLKNGVRALNIR
jgi:IgA peptidase M64